MILWDLYDSNLNNTHKTVSKEEDIPDNYYHLALEIWIINSNGELLLLRNTIDYSKRYPGNWCCIGGNLQSGEDTESSIRRIIKEKIGLSSSYSIDSISNPIKRDPYKYAYITCFVHADIDINHIVFEDNNSMEAKFVNKEELIKMCNNGEIAYYLISRINQEIIQYVK